MSALRYVVLHHTGIEHPHYDLLFEQAESSKLAAVRCSNWPPDAQTQFQRIADHRNIYLDYEGSLTQNRGSVARVEAGTCALHGVGKNTIILGLSTGREIPVPTISEETRPQEGK